MKLYSIMKDTEQLKQSYYKSQERAEEVQHDFCVKYKNESINLYVLEKGKWNHLGMDTILTMGSAA